MTMSTKDAIRLDFLREIRATELKSLRKFQLCMYEEECVRAILEHLEEIESEIAQIKPKPVLNEMWSFKQLPSSLVFYTDFTYGRGNSLRDRVASIIDRVWKRRKTTT